MTFWDSVKNVANEAAGALNDAAKDVSGSIKDHNEVSQLKRAIRAEEVKINGYYAQIGENVFKTNPTPPAGFELQYNAIKNAKAEIQRLQKELDMREPYHK